MQGFDVVIFSNDKHLRSALCEEVRLMGYSCGYGENDISQGSIIVYDLSIKEASAPCANDIIYIADAKEKDLPSLPKDAHILSRPFSLEKFSKAVRELSEKKFIHEKESFSVILFDSFLLVCGKRIDLTENEMIIFRALWDGNGKAVSRGLLEEITGANGDGNMVAVYISRLRSKLQTATDQRVILTVRDVGYRIAR